MAGSRGEVRPDGNPSEGVLGKYPMPPPPSNPSLRSREPKGLLGTVPVSPLFSHPPHNPLLSPSGTRVYARTGAPSVSPSGTVQEGGCVSSTDRAPFRGTRRVRPVSGGPGRDVPDSSSVNHLCNFGPGLSLLRPRGGVPCDLGHEPRVPGPSRSLFETRPHHGSESLSSCPLHSLGGHPRSLVDRSGCRAGEGITPSERKEVSYTLESHPFLNPWRTPLSGGGDRV